MVLRRMVAVSLVALAALPGTVQAGVVVTPGAVIANDMGESGGLPATNLFDQADLSNTYLSGATDFDTFVATTTANNTTRWQSGLNTPLGSMDFDLGQVTDLTGMVLWNDNSAGSIFEFNLLGANSADFIGAVSLGSFTTTINGLPPNAGVEPVPAEVFDLTDVSARYVRLNVTSNIAGPVVSYIRELAFEAADASAVDEPETLVLLVGALGLAVGRRHRRAR